MIQLKECCCRSTMNREDAMTFLLIIGVVLVVVLAIPRLANIDARRSKSRILNADWLADEDKFRIISRWGAQY